MKLDVSAWAVVGMMLGFATSVLAQDGVKPDAGSRPPGGIQEPEKKPEDGALKFFWKDGFKFETADKKFSGQFGGRLHIDSIWSSADDDVDAVVGEPTDGTEFRRARFFVGGILYERIEFKFEMDFAGDGRPSFTDVFIALKKLGIGEITVGHFKEPFNLEELTSSRFITFLERSLPNTFAPARNLGIMVSGHGMDDRLTYAVGAFRESDDFGDNENDGSEGDTAVTGRITFLPIYENKGESLLHVGLAASRRSIGDGSDVDTIAELQFRQRPDVHVGPRFVDTGEFTAETETLWGVEAAVVFGSMSAQAEYVAVSVGRPSPAGDADFTSFYFFVSWFLSGERRNYKTTSGAFDRVKPLENAFEGDGIGAFEVGLRFASIDLTDEAIAGGKMDTVTLAVNWYLNGHTRVMLNVILSDLERGAADGESSHIGLRFSFDF
ncbi:MAG TPA: porin [Planctomycetota bacterium]|nr:porin [Planctomycetota bacterium]